MRSVDTALPPSDPTTGIPAKTYPLEITTKLTYPDGHAETKVVNDTIPKIEGGQWYLTSLWTPFVFTKGYELPPIGTYTFKVKVLVDRVEMYNESRNFKVLG